MKKIKVINLYKHNYIYKNIKNLQSRQFVFAIIICLVTIFGFSYLSSVNKNVANSVSVFNPISELYRDVEVASFVTAGTCNFIVPVKTEKYIINSDSIDFEITNSIMVYAPEAGVVEAVDNAKKIIKIKHCDNMFSVISNIGICGVKSGDVLQKGKEIATAKVGTIVNFCIIIDDAPVDNLYLNKSFIKWK